MLQLKILWPELSCAERGGHARLPAQGIVLIFFAGAQALFSLLGPLTKGADHFLFFSAVVLAVSAAGDDVNSEQRLFFSFSKEPHFESLTFQKSMAALYHDGSFRASRGNGNGNRALAGDPFCPVLFFERKRAFPHTPERPNTSAAWKALPPRWRRLFHSGEAG